MADPLGPQGVVCWTTFPEEFVIQNVVESSRELRAFYEAERSNYKSPYTGGVI